LILIVGIFVHPVQIEFAHVLIHDRVIDKGEASKILLDSGGEGRS